MATGTTRALTVIIAHSFDYYMSDMLVRQYSMCFDSRSLQTLFNQQFVEYDSEKGIYILKQYVCKQGKHQNINISILLHSLAYICPPPVKCGLHTCFKRKIIFIPVRH